MSANTTLVSMLALQACIHNNPDTDSCLTDASTNASARSRAHSPGRRLVLLTLPGGGGGGGRLAHDVSNTHVDGLGCGESHMAS